MIDPKRVLNEFYNLCVEARCDFDLYRSMFEDHPQSECARGVSLRHIPRRGRANRTDGQSPVIASPRKP